MLSNTKLYTLVDISYNYASTCEISAALVWNAFAVECRSLCQSDKISANVLPRSDVSTSDVLASLLASAVVDTVNAVLATSAGFAASFVVDVPKPNASFVVSAAVVVVVVLAGSFFASAVVVLN